MSISAAGSDESRPAAGGTRLGSTTILLHWLVGLGVLGLLVFGFWLQTLPTGPGKTPYVQVHKSFGMLVFVVALFRLLWRWREGFPPPAGSHATWERRAAVSLQIFMIAATVLMPVTGILRSLAYARAVAIFDIPVIPKLLSEKHETLYAVSSSLHNGLAFALAFAVLIHVAAAIKHHMVDRDDTLPRIVFGGRRG